MISNYFKIAWRNLNRQKFYTIINVTGLAFGLAACLVIVLYIQNELSYDSYNEKADRIYRVDADVKFGGNQFQMSYRSAPEAQALVDDYPEVETAVRFRSAGSYLVKTKDEAENIKEHHVIWTDSTFFDIFSLNVLEGNAFKALNQPMSVAISKKIADKYYPGESPLGQSLILDNNYHMTVKAVYDDIPDASHFHFDILVSMVGDWPPIAREAKSTSFLSENFSTYLLLRQGANANDLEAKLPGFMDTHYGPELAGAFGGDFTLEKSRASGNKYDLSLTPLRDIHLHSSVKGDFEANGNITYVYLFGSIAALVLIIACINFMNLSTARSGNRAKEIGVRKVMGSLKKHLIRQFLTESFVVTAIGILLSIGIVYLMLPWFNTIANRQLSLPLSSYEFYLGLTIAALSIGLLAGLYPAFFLSGFKPIQALKGNISSGMKSGPIRSFLVVFQFVISIFLIIGTITIGKQQSFIQNKNLGFDKEQVIVVHDAYALRPNSVEPFKDEALKITGIESGTISGYLPVENDWSSRSNSSFWKAGQESNTENMSATQMWAVDQDYLKTFGINLIEGRWLSADFPSDSNAVVLNETIARRLDLGSNPVGSQIQSFEGEAKAENIVTWTVVGIVEDFHFSTMKESITGLAFYLGKHDGNVSFKFRADNTKNVIQALGETWKKLAPGQPFEYSFLDQDFERMYQSEERLGELFTIFSGLAIMIACLGLFALTTFTAEQRTKEIGIRKVLGASVASIVVLLSREFGKLILIAFAVAVPLAWYGVNWWLSGYTYKTEIGITVYVLAGVVSFFVAWITMGYQSIKAANSNPVDALRSE
ncbi:MAG: ABC transporter permease [Cyclobacteriaceae bacterium]|nr:ABC transporter permease [Cyclobacteriaceae bacterium]